MSDLVIIFVIAAVVIGLAILAHQQAERRRKELEARARRHGFSFSAERDRKFDGRFGAFEALKRGSSRYAYNIAKGRRGESFVHTFDFHYQVTRMNANGRPRTDHHNFSAVIVESGRAARPLHIRTETFFDRVGEFFGIDDIDFELDEFNREFHVKSPDRRWAFDVLHQETMEFLLREERFTMDMQEGAMLVYRDKLLDVKELDSALRVAEGVLGRIPSGLARKPGETR